jgi:hypothetical protein
MRQRLSVALAGLLLLALGMGLGAVRGTFSAFSSATSNAASFSSYPDWTAPTVTASTIGKTTGGTPAGGKPGGVKTGGTFRAYANATDSGNPAAGVGSVTADLTSVNGQSAVALTTTGGPWTVDGTTYSYRSAQLTVSGSPNNYNYPVSASDLASPANTTAPAPTFPVTIDNTAPSASDVQITDVAGAGGTVGRAELGDLITLTFSEQIDPYGVIPSTSWNGTTATNVVVRLNNGGGANDTVTIWNAGNTAQTNLGSINLGGKNYSTANITFGATGTPSTMVQSGSTITITLGTQSAAATTASANTTMTWTPSTAAFDIAGNAMSATARTETGAADLEF